MTTAAWRRLARVAPLAVIAVTSLMVARLATRAPDTLEPARSWCAPSATRLLGCGEGGVDLVPLVAHAVARGLVLAVAVAAFGFLLGTPLGAGVALALGVAPWSILARHVLPNLLGVAAVQLGATGAAVVVSEAALGFVGFGPRDGVSLGSVMDQGVAAMLRAPHVILVGAIAVFVTSASMLLAGRAADGGAGERSKASDARA